MRAANLGLASGSRGGRTTELPNTGNPWFLSVCYRNGSEYDTSRQTGIALCRASGHPACHDRIDTQEIGSCLRISAKSDAAQAPQPGQACAAVWVWILGFCLAALIATYMLFVEPPPPRKIVIASGGQNGAYFRFAQKYAEELQKEGLSVEVRETAGSVENLRLLGQEGSGVAVAIVQSGVASPEEVTALLCPGQPVPRALVGLLPRRQAARAPQSARGQTHRCRSAGQRYLRHRHAVACRQRPDRIPILHGEFAGRAGPGERRCRCQGLAEGRAGCRVLRRRLRGRLHPGPPERSHV